MRIVRLGGAILLALVLLHGNAAQADTTLTSLVNAAYGPRTEDPSLHSLAHERAQFQVAHSGGLCLGNGSLTHEGLITAEVLSCNFDGPAKALEQWQGSPSHDEILRGSFDLIGCGSAAGLDGAVFWACVLSVGPASPAPAPIPQPPPAEQPAPSPPAGPALLPDTRTR